ncbi:hypothetical protein [Nonomuraea diastatica]|uniref:Uncharacterized protein n=1 Tax=Nonomuraea diastatica TaxID=1848329 RepID=A0A4R4WTL2_9ACTN|nr:hypothetical protein [Nonomuraea diastatica]TDD20942.1 hypothetical protein E1294_16255 [Nonomuraea diastatica]
MNTRGYVSRGKSLGVTMRQRSLLLIAVLTMCAPAPAVSTSTGTPFTGRGAGASSGTSYDQAGESLVEDTFHLTQGIEVRRRLLPTAEGVTFRPGHLAAGIRVDGSGLLHGTPRRSGTFAAPVEICSGRSCREQELTLVVLGYEPWEPRELIFHGGAGVPLDGEIGVEGGPDGVLPTFTVTDQARLPAGVSIGPDGRVGGVPAAPGVFEVPVRICVAGNCAGVVVRIIVG